MPDANGGPATHAADVYAVFGPEPEVTAYALAKYSRSALPLREALREISGQQAEKFLNTFYFQYGHRSIADLAHVALAIERLSILAAIDVADESKWDGQERSTRYQAFRHGDWITPPELDSAQGDGFTAAMAALFDGYEAAAVAVREHYRRTVPRPEAMKPETYDRTLRARAFDAARYLLPLGTQTSLGQIVSARVLEQQIVRLLSSPRAEVRAIGAALKRAASEPAFDPRAPQTGAATGVRVAPTLVKYTDPNPYQMETRRALAAAAAELLGETPIAAAPRVELAPALPLEIELPATLLYSACHHPYRQVADAVAALPAARRQEILSLATRARGPHDEMARPFQAGAALAFDLCMDIGGFRDLHRHRRCTQIPQDFTFGHGYETPNVFATAGWEPDFHRAMRAARDAAAPLGEPGHYLLPLGYRHRCLFKMDLAELIYIAELRTAPGGHIAYRRVAWEMWQAAARRHPALADLARVCEPTEQDALLQR
ncbi:MAG: FAD-dependent thymidylate synthase [Terriglobales bacterium]